MLREQSLSLHGLMSRITRLLQGPNQSLEQSSPELWHAIFDLNLRVRTLPDIDTVSSAENTELRKINLRGYRSIRDLLFQFPVKYLKNLDITDFENSLSILASLRLGSHKWQKRVIRITNNGFTFKVTMASFMDSYEKALCFTSQYGPAFRGMYGFTIEGRPDRVKIGFGHSIQDKTYTLSGNHPDRMQVEFIIPGAVLKNEKMFHRMYKKTGYSLGKEWYTYTPKFMHEVDRFASKVVFSRTVSLSELNPRNTPLGEMRFE